MFSTSVLHCVRVARQLVDVPEQHDATKLRTMDEAGITNVSATIDIEALRAYRLAVGPRTREIVKSLQPEDMKKKVESARIQRLREEETVLKAGQEVVDYWSKRDIAGLLLMPPTRHNFVHLMRRGAKNGKLPRARSAALSADRPFWYQGRGQRNVSRQALA